ncbi:hypothetical protein AYL99_11665 [Fonsecaea erecta]|uniref:Uncharacterized protein n=1 Tax=Fonsecaea erecta TaxID=1367422 RepID=A0A178Z2Y5_9EURO|nr:hypothetical protein AYL99_11665 [Fonsecaea erecta]OAP54130.1 hypothetical protein AYL99_11665 [Fonsecaea erecta]
MTSSSASSSSAILPPRSTTDDDVPSPPDSPYPFFATKTKISMSPTTAGKPTVDAQMEKWIAQRIQQTRKKAREEQRRTKKTRSVGASEGHQIILIHWIYGSPVPIFQYGFDDGCAMTPREFCTAVMRTVARDPKPEFVVFDRELRRYLDTNFDPKSLPEDVIVELSAKSAAESSQRLQHPP